MAAESDPLESYVRRVQADTHRYVHDLLGDQAALAIVSSQCFVSVDRKLKTVQGFLDLLKS